MLFCWARREKPITLVRACNFGEYEVSAFVTAMFRKQFEAFDHKVTHYWTMPQIRDEDTHLMHHFAIFNAVMVSTRFWMLRMLKMELKQIHRSSCRQRSQLLTDVQALGIT